MYLGQGSIRVETFQDVDARCQTHTLLRTRALFDLDLAQQMQLAAQLLGPLTALRGSYYGSSSDIFIVKLVTGAPTADTIV